MSPEEKLDLYCRAYLAALSNSSPAVHCQRDDLARTFVRDVEAFWAETWPRSEGMSPKGKPDPMPIPGTGRPA